MMVIDQLAEAAHRQPSRPLVPGLALTAAEAWAQSGAVASWLVAQGFGPGGRTLAPPGDGPRGQQLVVRLGAMRAGAAIDPAGSAIPYGRMANCPVDAAVAERRLHLDESTAVRVGSDGTRCHGDYRNIGDVVNDLK
jgi:hypothetical protein